MCALVDVGGLGLRHAVGDLARELIVHEQVSVRLHLQDSRTRITVRRSAEVSQGRPADHSLQRRLRLSMHDNDRLVSIEIAHTHRRLL